MPFKTGKLDPKFNHKTLRMSRYQGLEVVPPPPAKAYYEYKIPPETIGMYFNDVLGICVPAWMAHHLMLITAHAGKLIVPDPQDVLAFYEKYGGYDPSQVQSDGSNPTDQGMAMTDALNAWQTDGFCGHKIDGWGAVDHTDLLRSNQALWLFMGLGVGVQLPNSAQTQFANGQNWEVLNDDGGIDGGHAILESGDGTQGRNEETWGKGDQKCSNDWKNKYADEQYCVLTHDLIEAASGVAPSGYNYAALQADLAALKAA